MPPREIHTHAINPANEAIGVFALDEPGPGGANHDYEINTTCGDADGKAAYEAYAGRTDWKSAISGAPLPPWESQAPIVKDAWRCAAGAARRSPRLLFQNGPVKENGEGVNGITHEALIAIIIDRLDAFQRGPYANAYNARAVSALAAARDALHQRTIDREKRGVEGTHTI